MRHGAPTGALQLDVVITGGPGVGRPLVNAPGKSMAKKRFVVVLTAHFSFSRRPWGVCHYHLAAGSPGVYVVHSTEVKSVGLLGHECLRFMYASSAYQPCQSKPACCWLVTVDQLPAWC